MIATKEWTTPEGKVISFTSERIEIDGCVDDEDSYYLEINTFPKNTQLSIIRESWDSPDGYGEEPILLSGRTKWKRLPNTEFIANREQILAECTLIVKNNLTIPKNNPIDWTKIPEVVGIDELTHYLRFEEY
jgi:hypothetical protein